MFEVVKASSDTEIDDSHFGMILEDIKSLLGSLPCSCFPHVIREANVVAHKAARVALKDGLAISWSGPLPDVCQGFIAPVCAL